MVVTAVNFALAAVARRAPGPSDATGSFSASAAGAATEAASVADTRATIITAIDLDLDRAPGRWRGPLGAGSRVNRDGPVPPRCPQDAGEGHERVAPSDRLAGHDGHQDV